MADLGQVFTKGNVAQYMVSLFDLAKEAKIMDPCYGAGSFLDALGNLLTKKWAAVGFGKRPF